MKMLEVVAGIIQDNGRILGTQRGYGEFQGQWEFPGGKIEPGESRETALRREIKEELEVEIEVKELFQVIEYNYPEFHLSMACFLCEIKSGEIVLKEHSGAKWLQRDELFSVNWLPADIGVVKKLQEEHQE